MILIGKIISVGDKQIKLQHGKSTFIFDKDDLTFVPNKDDEVNLIVKDCSVFRVKKENILEVKPRKRKHTCKPVVTTYSLKRVSAICKSCGERLEVEVPETFAKRMAKVFENSLSPSKDDNVHYLWHKFLKETKYEHGLGWAISNDQLESIAFKYAKKYPEDVRVVSCDDSHHSSSSLVLFEHKCKNSYMGTSVIFIPQCAGGPATQFFLYPSHRAGFIQALQEINKISKETKKVEKKIQKEKSKEINNIFQEIYNEIQD